MKSLFVTLIVSVLAVSAFADNSQVAAGAVPQTGLHAAGQKHAKLHKSKARKHTAKAHHKTAPKKLASV